ncbi:MAG: response regulator [Planctomycetota bacterium]|jgi:DNA-binding NarL/FixJ family response regulator
MKRPRVLLADDHKLFLEGLENLLRSEFELVGSVGDGLALLTAAKKLRPDVVVADLAMPGLNGIEVIRRLKDAGLKAKVVLLTMHDDPEYAAQALQEGAAGYVLKHSASSELVAAIRLAVEGQVYLTPMITEDVVRALSSGPRSQEAKPSLTPRQRDVLKLLTRGLAAKEIAARLGISARTVE